MDVDVHTLLRQKARDETDVSNALRHCFHCEKPETPDFKLRRCGRCGYALYCSEKCQKIAWRAQHKRMCTPPHPDSDAQVCRYGYLSETHFRRDMQDFARSHAWAFMTGAKAAWHILTLGDDPPEDPLWLAIYQLRCLSTPDSQEPNPAHRFEFDTNGFSLNHFESCLSADRGTYEAAVRMRDEVAKSHQHDPTFLGALFVLFRVPDVNSSVMAAYPVFKPGPLQPPKELKRAALQEVFNICMLSINRRFPLRCPAGRRSMAPLPGQFVRVERRWTWEPLFARWEDYSPDHGPHEGLNTTLKELKVGLSVPELMCMVTIV